MADEISWDEKSPSFPFYVRDWLGENDLAACSWAARGLWVTALCRMWLSSEKGRLEFKNRAQLCRVLGGSEVELSPLIDELIDSGVASSDGPGSLINRRMFRVAKLKQIRICSGSKGGKKTAEKVKSGQVVPQFAQAKPEANGVAKKQQKPLPSSSSSSSSSFTNNLLPTTVVTHKTYTDFDKSAVGVEIQHDKPVGEKKISPVYSGCDWFRISDDERTLVRNWYAKNNLPEKLIRFAIREVEQWMANGSYAAGVQARKSSTHFRHLYASWVIEKANRAMELYTRLAGKQGSAIAARNSTVTERNADFFKAKESQLTGDLERDTTGNSEIVETTFERMDESCRNG